MLSDMQNILNDGGNFEFCGQSGETPVLHWLVYFLKTETVEFYCLVGYVWIFKFLLLGWFRLVGVTVDLH